jgi:hypothetical protein
MTLVGWGSSVHLHPKSIAHVPPVLTDACYRDNTIVRGHALIRNLRTSFSVLTVQVPLNLRLAVAWPQLARAI